jgi:hypothetical protein
MSIKLVSTGGGSVTIQEPNTASDFTLSVPAATGSLVLSGTTPSFNGISFPATQSASADANTLDDYEEGTWTPTLSGNVTAGSYSGSTIGYYTKVGNLVTVVGRIENGTLSGGVGQIAIGGLPFVVRNSSRNEGAAPAATYNFNFTTAGAHYLVGDPGTSRLVGLETSNGGVWSGWNVTNTSTLYMNFTFTYITN